MEARRQSKQKEQGRKKRVYHKISHHALGIYGASNNPFVKKRRTSSSVWDGQESRKAEAATLVNAGNNEKGPPAEEEDEKKDQSHEIAQGLKKCSRPPLSRSLPPKAKPKSYLEKLWSRLFGGQFRMLNQKLYTSSGYESFKFFKEDPAAFQSYHAGYQEQMSRWPSQPLNVIINWLKKRSNTLIVADFGCGSGKLAKSIDNKVYSLDLVAFDETIIECNMANTPLKKQSIDVAVFCLSLMGTDYPSFLHEAHRVLKPRGTLLIAEVRSRFDPSNGGADPAHFMKALSTLGFKCVHKDFSNKLFVVFELMKQGLERKPQQCKWPLLKACIYKRR